MKPAVLVLDMIVDFTTGKLGTASARAIRPAIRKLVQQARRKKIPVVYCQEAHTPDDPELKVWGRHGIFRTPGAKTDPMLASRPDESIVPKHTYGGFYGTDLDEVLKAEKVDAVILTGVCTDIGVQHTAADAFFRGYRVLVPRDGVAALTPEDHERALAYMKRTYAVTLTTIPALIQSLRPRAKRRRVHNG